MNFLNKIKIGVRLGAGFSVLLMMTLIAVSIGWFQLRIMQADFNEVTVNTLPSILLAGDLRSDAEDVRRSQIRLVSEPELSARKRIVSDIKDTRSLLKTIYEAYGQDMIKGEQDRRLWKDAGTALSAFEQLSVKIEADALAEVDEPVADATPPADPAALVAAAEAEEKLAQEKATKLSLKLQDAVYGDAFSAFGAVIDKLDKLKAFNLQRSRDAEARGKATFKRSQIVLAIAAGATLLLGVLISLVLTRSVVVPLSRAVTALRGVADGNLDTDIDLRGKDELSDMLRELARMQDSLRIVVTDIRESSESVSNSSVEIAAGIFDLSTRTEHQAARLEETAASMEQLTATVKQSTQTAREVDQLADLASNAALRGSKVVGQVVETMHGIQHSSNRISEIIAVIDGIAFQTNILALNAAVEAARAGEQGRGFAVVASEVRNLAQRSAGAAKEIKTLIIGSAEQVTGGSRLVEEAGRSMADIQSQIDKVTSLICGILSASTEQSTGIALVNQAVSELDTATQMNAALVEQASAASESLKEQAGRLVEVVSVFRTNSEQGDEADEQVAQDDDEVAADGVEVQVTTARARLALPS